MQLGSIRLAWWRERLEELDRGVAPPAEPRLQAIAAHLIPAGVSGAELARLEYCWLALLSPFPWDDLVADAIAERGGILFGIGAELLGCKAADGKPLGVVWSLAEVAQHCSDERSRRLLSDRARMAIRAMSQQRVPSDLGPLEALTLREAYDLVHGNGRGLRRLLAALRYLVSGKLPGS